MVSDEDDLLDELFSLYSPPTRDFAWEQRQPFGRAVREVLSSSDGHDAIATRTLTGEPVVLVLSGGEATVLTASPDGATTTYLGSLAGGILSKTTKRVDEMRRETTLVFRHERFPDGGILDRATERYQFERQEKLFEILRPFSVPA
jgi:hypothetical protein